MQNFLISQHFQLPKTRAVAISMVLRSSELHFKLFPLFHFRDVGLGDVVTVGQCRPLSKTVRFNVLKVSKGKGSKDKKQFEKF